tara:strand:- start:1193 stop:1339 length:147 start_codon:yes stop_codon:yes gene_type:complete
MIFERKLSIGAMSQVLKFDFEKNAIKNQSQHLHILILFKKLLIRHFQK